jgi:hypothetical protein
VKKIGSRLVVLATASTVLAFGAFGSPASANHSWNGYHWVRTTNPFTLKLGDNLSAGWKSYLGTTSSDWSKSTVLDTTIVPGMASTRRCKPTAGRDEVCNAAYGYNGWLGVAQVWVSGSHITQGTVKVNDTYFNTSTYNTPAERNHVMCQEVGHTLGLDHQDESGASLGTCMDYSQDPGSQHPNQHDYDQLAAIYAHLDGTTTVGSSPAGAAGRASGASPRWGSLVSGSRSGRSAIYMRTLRGGRALVTFVTWAH